MPAPSFVPCELFEWPPPPEAQAPAPAHDALSEELEKEVERLTKALRRCSARVRKLAPADPVREALIRRVAAAIEGDWTVEPFVPTEVQDAVLKALDVGPLRQAELVERTGYDPRQLHRPTGLDGLVEAGKVRRHKRFGYYRTDRAPAELTRAD